jgi:choline dehydrogenase-like flavoprotein
LFDAGAERVYLATKDPTTFDGSQISQLEGLVDNVIEEPADLGLATSHPQGGNALSADPAISVVDERFQVRGVAGLFVGDASLFPAGCGVDADYDGAGPYGRERN